MKLDDGCCRIDFSVEDVLVERRSIVTAKNYNILIRYSIIYIEIIKSNKNVT
jgi:hypothetical protein